MTDTMNEADLKAELERLKKENESLKRRNERTLSLKVSQKGALSLYGLGRFPVTLYKEQWLRVLEMTEDIRKFIQEHDKELKGRD